MLLPLASPPAFCSDKGERQEGHVTDGGSKRGAVLPYGLNTLYAIRVLKLSQSKYAALVKMQIICIELLTNTVTITHQVGGYS